MTGPHHGRLAGVLDTIERSVIALILGLMAVITFVNVVLRYVFNESLIWGLDVVLVLFAWLVIFGVSHGFSHGAHLGVDALTARLAPRRRRRIGMLAAAVTVIYALLLMKGAWDYWAPFAGLDSTSGRWFPTGFEESRDRGWYETDRIPMLDWLRFLEPAINMGERYDKMPRVIPYLILPLGALLIFLRVVQAAAGVAAGRRKGLIAAHELDESD